VIDHGYRRDEHWVRLVAHQLGGAVVLLLDRWQQTNGPDEMLPVQGPLCRLDRAYDAFGRRLAHYVACKGFRSRRHWRSFAFPEVGNRVRLDDPAGRLRITRSGIVRVRRHRPQPGVWKTCSIVRRPDGWYANIVSQVADSPAVLDLYHEQRAAIDIGVETLATVHTGERIENCRALRLARRKLLAEQRGLTRKQRGSAWRAKQRQRLGPPRMKVAGGRRDHLHKTSRQLAELIDVEDLTVTAMVHSAKGTVAGPARRVRQKAGLNRGILDAAWDELLGLLAHKLAEPDGQLVCVTACGTSQACSQCGQLVLKPLQECRQDCPHCGLSIHHDDHAATNSHDRAYAVPAEAA